MMKRSGKTADMQFNEVTACYEGFTCDGGYKIIVPQALYESTVFTPEDLDCEACTWTDWALSGTGVELRRISGFSARK